MKQAIILIIVTIVVVLGSLVAKGKINLPFKSETPIEQEQTLNASENQQPTEMATTTKTAPGTATKTTTVKTTTSPAIAKDGAYIISYENTGFKPKTLTIQVGKSVRFINNSSKAMLIYATDQKDRIYSSLNQSKTVGKGGIYNFMFTQTGVWSYYNYNNPTDTGIIIVNPKI